MSLERHQVLLEQCGLDKTLLSLPLEELAAVDRFLSTQWHIDFRKSDLSLHGQLKAVSEGATREVSSIALSAQSLVTPDGSRTSFTK